MRNLRYWIDIINVKLWLLEKQINIGFTSTFESVWRMTCWTPKNTHSSPHDTVTNWSVLPCGNGFGLFLLVLWFCSYFSYPFHSTYARLLLLLVNIIEGLGQYFNKVPSSCSSTTVDSGGNIDDIITGVDPIKVSPQSTFQWRMLNAQQLFSKRRRNGRKEIDCKVLW